MFSYFLLVTSEGPIEISLYANRARITVNIFLHYVDAKRLDGGSIYRAVTDENDNGKPKIDVI